MSTNATLADWFRYTNFLKNQGKLVIDNIISHESECNTCSLFQVKQIVLKVLGKNYCVIGNI